MNPKKLQLWVDALRSDEYQQGQGKLRSTDNTYCCLGVLCEVAIKDGVDVEVKEYRLSPDGPAHAYSYGGTTTFPPPAVMEWLGAPPGTANPRVKVPEGLKHVYDGETVSVVSLNDSDGYDFTEIADLLEATYMPKVAA